MYTRKVPGACRAHIENDGCFRQHSESIVSNADAPVMRYLYGGGSARQDGMEEAE